MANTTRNGPGRATSSETIPGLSEAIEAAWADRRDGLRPSLYNLLHDAMTETAYHFTNALWVRNLACDEADCPNREPWDIALTGAAHEAMHAAREEALALIHGRMADFARQFQAEHPEAELRR